MSARAALDGAGLPVERERSTSREPLSDGDAAKLLGQVETVHLCRGRKVERLDAAAVDVDRLKGPTGKIRAPLVWLDDVLLVGYGHEALAELLAS